MNILDENIPESQRQLLVDWRIRVKKIGRDIGRQGLKDREDVIPLLQSLRYPTLFTRDMWIFDRQLCHKRYAIVCMNVEAEKAAGYVRKLLRHPKWDTKAKRMGKVIRISPTKIHYWTVKSDKETGLDW